MSNLLKEIEDYRQKMVFCALNYGFTSDETIKCSQHLDYLLNVLRTQEQTLVQQKK